MFIKNNSIRAGAGRLFFLISLLVFCAWQSGHAQLWVSASGNWNTVLPVASVTEAGNDFYPTYTSALDQVLLSFDRTQGAAPFRYRIDIRKNDIDWHPSLQLYARRSGDGNAQQGNSTITGGNAFQLLTNTNQLFFTGSRGRTNVPVQFQLTGVSVLIPAKTHITTVIYTITEL